MTRAFIASAMRLCACLLPLASAGCQSDGAAPQRVEKDFAWQIDLIASGRAPRIELRLTGDGIAPNGTFSTSMIYLTLDCSFNHFGVDASWGGAWPPTDSPNEGYDYSRGEMLLHVNGREVWRYRGAGYSRPGMIAAGDDLSEPGHLLVALGEARTLDVEARFDNGITSVVRLDLSGQENVSGINLPQDQAIETFVRRCTDIRAARPIAQ